MQATLAADSIGPVDVAIISFEGNRFNGDVAPALLELQDSGTVRILDLAFVRKESDGSVAAIEVADSEVAAAFSRADGQVDLLSDEDLADIGAGLDPASSALVVVWENSWATRLAGAIRASHGEVVRLERIPRDVVLRAIDAADEQ